jgi:PAS domain S-box-containing protein
MKKYLYYQKISAMKKLKVLLLEDSTDDIDLITQTINRANIDYAIVSVGDKEAYLAAIKSNKYDIILSDNGLPQFNAFDALEFANEFCPGTPFILVTGTMPDEFAVEIMKLGAWDYILKDRLHRLPNAVLSAHNKHVLMLGKQLAEQKLQRSEANMRSIFDNSGTGYVLLDPDFNIVSFNKIISRFSSCHLNNALVEGDNILNYFKGEQFSAFNESLKSALDNKAVNYEMPFKQQDGTIKWFYIGYHPVTNPDGVALGVIVSTLDVTSRKMLELHEKKVTADLIQRKNELEQFTYIISHNLRAPVANLLGISNMLDSDYDHEADERALIKGVKTSVEKLDNIIADLNQIIQLKQSIVDKIGKVSLKRIVEDIKISISNTITSSGVDIKCSFREIESIYTVNSLMYSIFFNLISNSIKYRQADILPVIEITSIKTATHFELIFKDNGVGIDLEKKGNMLFGLYKRFHTELAEGKGMGLFMVKTHVETLGGTISIESAVNRGTQFTIKFELEKVLPAM